MNITRRHLCLLPIAAMPVLAMAQEQKAITYVGDTETSSFDIAAYNGALKWATIISFHFTIPNGLVDRRQHLNSLVRDQFGTLVPMDQRAPMRIVAVRPNGKRYEWADIIDMPLEDLQDEFGYVVKWSVV